MQFFKSPCIDLGAGNNPVKWPGVRAWDKPDGDITYMKGVPDESFATVFSSHALEDIPDAFTALRNWWRILKTGGHIVIVMPHRDLYEKSIQLPSKFNGAHTTMWLPYQSQPPCTFSLLHACHECFTGGFFLSLRVFDENNTNFDKPDEHANGEFSLETIWRKGVKRL